MFAVTTFLFYYCIKKIEYKKVRADHTASSYIQFNYKDTLHNVICNKDFDNIII